MISLQWFRTAQSIAALAVISAALVAGAITDAKTRTIPNAVPISIFLAGLFVYGTSIGEKALSLLAIGTVLAVTTRLSGLKSGGGDVKLYCALAFSLGLSATAIILFITYLLMRLHSSLQQAQNKKGLRLPACCYIAPAFITILLTTAAIHIVRFFSVR